MKNVVILGAGKIGATLADMLTAARDYRITVADRSPAQLNALDSRSGIHKAQLDIADSDALHALLAGCFAVISAAPYHLTTHVAEAAARANVHYLDLTEDVASTRRVKQLAVNASSAFIPQCGLAPGFVSIVANDLAKRFDTLDSMRLRVGALPQYPSNALNYNLTWSTDGVINEYCEPCEAIVDGLPVKTHPLEEREEFSLDGVLYEAFNTSGGLGSLCEALAGKVRILNYRTIRYPGHAAIMKALLHDLRLKDRRDVLKDILENALPETFQDVVIVFVTASGFRDGRLTQETYANKIYSRRVGEVMRSAIQWTTASGAAAILDLLAAGKLTRKGFVRQEDVTLDAILRNRFGQVFAVAGQPSAQAQTSKAARRRQAFQSGQAKGTAQVGRQSSRKKPAEPPGLGAFSLQS
jgi:saccharopine dehydrogenase-like NADP-dependent oxidoreductase